MLSRSMCVFILSSVMANLTSSSPPNAMAWYDRQLEYSIMLYDPLFIIHDNPRNKIKGYIAFG